MPPFSSFLVLNSVLVAIRSISLFERGQLGGDGPTIRVGQGVVRALDRQLTHALQDRVGLVQTAFSGLDHRDAVLGVADSLVQALGPGRAASR